VIASAASPGGEGAENFEKGYSTLSITSGRREEAVTARASQNDCENDWTDWNGFWRM